MSYIQFTAALFEQAAANKIRISVERAELSNSLDNAKTEAALLGSRAFFLGMYRDEPTKDSKLIEVIVRLTQHTSQDFSAGPIFLAWLAGWDEANAGV